MSEPLTLRATGALTLPDRALTRLTALEHGLFALCAGAAGAGLMLLPVAQARPALALGLAFGLGLGAVRPWAPLLVPAFMALTLGAALGADRLGVSSLVANGHPRPRDRAEGSDRLAWPAHGVPALRPAR